MPDRTMYAHEHEEEGCTVRYNVVGSATLTTDFAYCLTHAVTVPVANIEPPRASSEEN